MSTAGQSERHIRFVAETVAGDVVVMSFKDPSPSYAVLRDGSSDGDSFDVVLLPATGAAAIPAGWLEDRGNPEAAPPIYVKFRGVDVVWRPGRAVLQCDREQGDLLLTALVEFAHYERELRHLEAEIAAAWPKLEADKALAFDITNEHLKHSDELGARMGRTFQRRIRFARTEPHLHTPDPKLPATAQKLGEELRERTQMEARAEALDAQIEVFEHIYEMASQRMGEFKAARQGHLMEWGIIWILVAEAALMLIQTVFRLRS